ncbi:hypothetical protein ACJMK2_033971 [Sinanodonta woodiana]|uniref:Protein N-terminal asparagine amidohydrolase n=1 Tax=Sinanodonta woodiana TaxID=1069815 RepID=A0ABD3WRG3_SINWO
MPLLIDEKPMGSAPKTVEEFVKKYPNFRESSIMLCSQESRLVGPDGLLYIGQREMAATSPSDDKIKILGTDDATTCHIVILRHTGSCATAVAHLDGCGTDKAVARMIDIVKDLTGGKQWGRLELHLAGGFKDERGLSEDLSIKILGAFNSASEEIHLSTACITDLNNTTRKNIQWPMIYGLAINVKTGEIFRASFADRGPDMSLRSARHFTGEEEVLSIYDYKKQRMTIGPFLYSTMDEIDLLCRLPDQFIRQHLSTSPEQEPPHFEAGVRAALVQIRDHPDPMKSIFTDGKPRMYTKQPDGSWARA